MKTEVLKFSSSALEAMQALRIQVEINEKTHLRCKNTDELVQLLEIATRSSHAPVKESFKKLLNHLSPEQLTYFSKVGVNLEQPGEDKVVKKSYRGVQLPETVKSSSVDKVESNTSAGKRKIIYRGQVKWV